MNGSALRPQSMRRPAGGLIDRTQPLPFTFDGKSYAGYAGDTLASALLANGIHLVGRSFKYHRPRGILSAGSEEPNALVELRSGARREPNTRATLAELFDGLEAVSQNRWPSLRFDVQAVAQVFAPMLGAGFYYKTFMWPARLWEALYEPMIRRAAGLGRGTFDADPDHYEKAFAFCDVLVIGAGPAGLMAARAAARSGARVLLADEDFRFGGRCLAERRYIDDEPSAIWATRAAAELASMHNVRLMSRTTVFGSYDHGVYAAVERVSDHLSTPPAFLPRQRLWRIVAARCVLATGALERPLLFANNDRPGIMLAGAARAYANRYSTLVGRRVVLFTDNDDAWTTADDLQSAGAKIIAIIDPRGHVPRTASQSPEARIITGSVQRAHGGLRLNSVDVQHANGHSERLECDLLAMSGGWTPALHLSSHQGGRPRWDDARKIFLPHQLPPGMSVAGAVNGDFTLADALAAGDRAGCEAVTALGFTLSRSPPPRVGVESDAHDTWWGHAAGKGKCFVDFQNDVTTADIELAEREGFRSPEHLKRYTTLGMGTDQGKTSNVNGLATLAALTGATTPGSSGATTFRPPYTPVAIGALAGLHRGRRFRPTRLTPSHALMTEQGAVFVESGLWLRPQYFPKPGDADWLAATHREVMGVRSGVGICDVSTLGKIDLQGSDAVDFLERVYANGWKSLAVGRARYGLMLREDGFILDDGTVSRLGADHYYITTTTANAAAVYQHLQFCHQILWPRLDVQIASVSEQWAQFSIAGPRSRELLRAIIHPDESLSNDAFPYLAARPVALTDGTSGRLFRISFSGELAYELAVPSRTADRVIRRLFAVGAPLGVIPYGLEALSVMRIEKGHVAGNELNGQTTAFDLGLGGMLSTRKDYVGAVLARRPELLDPARPRLVGLKPVNPRDSLGSGAHLLPAGSSGTAAKSQGHITSVAHSPVLGHWIALGLLSGGPERHGERIVAVDPLRSRTTELEVCQPVFIDPDGSRLRV